MAEIDPIALFTEDMADNDSEVVIAAADRLTAVAAAVGPKRVIAELLPALARIDNIKNDSALASIARQLNNVYELSGGQSNPEASNIVSCIELLAIEEEVVIRDNCIKSACTIMKNTSSNDILKKFLPLYKKLASNEWFASRVSACGMTSSLLKYVSDQYKPEIYQIFQALCNDDTPMVKRAAILELGEYSLEVGKDNFKNEVFPLFKLLSYDDRDSLRALIPKSLSMINSVCDINDYNNTIGNLIEGLADDQSWKVRLNVAKMFPKFIEINNESIINKFLLPIYKKLLTDTCTEVRCASINVLSNVCKVCNSNSNINLEILTQTMEILCEDPYQQVRVQLSECLATVCVNIHKDLVVKYLVPVFQNLCKDDDFEVRNHVIDSIEPLGNILGSQGASSALLPSIVDLAKDLKWRVRAGIVSKLSILAKLLSAKIFEKRLQSVLTLALNDHVYSIRKEACKQLGEVIEILGHKWAGEKLFPTALALYDKTQNYLHRMTCLFFILNTSISCPGEVIEKQLLQVVLTATTDDVANVRIAASKCLVQVIPKIDKKIVQSKIKPLLLKNINDSDLDVAYFSSIALRLCQ